MYHTLQIVSSCPTTHYNTEMHTLGGDLKCRRYIPCLKLQMTQKPKPSVHRTANLRTLSLIFLFPLGRVLLTHSSAISHMLLSTSLLRDTETWKPRSVPFRPWCPKISVWKSDRGLSSHLPWDESQWACFTAADPNQGAMVWHQNQAALPSEPRAPALLQPQAGKHA